MSGLGTNTQESATGAVTTNSPFAPIVAPEMGLINEEQSLPAQFSSPLPTAADNAAYAQGQAAIGQLPSSLGLQAGNAAQQYLGTGGDPYGRLKGLASGS